MAEPATCGDIKCPSGSTNIVDAERVICDNGQWAESQCCDKLCSSYDCPSNCTKKRGPSHIRCNHAGCTTDMCCNYH